MDIKKFLETVDKFDFAGEKQGQQPGQQWSGTDKGLPGTKLVGELEKHVQETHVERKLRKDFEEFDSDDWSEWDEKINRLKKRAQQGELVTVWDPEQRVYKNVPKSEIKEYQNRQDQDAQVTSPPSPDASQSALDQIRDKIFARDVEGETVEEQDATPGFDGSTTTTSTNNKQQALSKLAPNQQAWMGKADPTDPYIRARMPRPTPTEPGTGIYNPYSGKDAQRFAGMSRADQEWYVRGGQKPDINDPYIALRAPDGGRQVKPQQVRTQPSAQTDTRPVVRNPSAISSPVNTANVRGTNLPPAGTQSAQTKVRPTVVDQLRTAKADADAYKKVPQQQLRKDTHSAEKPIDAPKQPAAPKTSERTTWRSLAKLNPQIKNPDRIYPGQEITLPNSTKAIVVKGDTLSGIAQRYRQGGYADDTPAQDKTTGFAGRSKGPGGPVVDPNAKATVKTTSKTSSKSAEKPGDEFSDEFSEPLTTKQASSTAGGMVKTMGEIPRAAPEKDIGTASGYVQDLTPKTRSLSTKAAPTKDKDPTNAQLKQQLMGAESGGRNIRNIAGSSAFGQFQITRDTFRNAQNQLPDGHPAKGISWKDFQKDTTAQGLVMDQLLTDYRNSLSVLKQPVTARNIYALHHFGATNAGELFKADPNAKLSSLGAQWSNPEGDIYTQNPVEPDMTVSQALGYLQKRMDRFDPNRRKKGRTSESLMADYQKFLSEYGNQQNPDAQASSGDTPESDAEAELKRQRMDRRVSQGTMGGLSAILPPGTNTTLAASALTKIVDQKPLTPQENQAISGLMPLLARAAEEPSTSASLKTALGKAGMLMKLGIK